MNLERNKRNLLKVLLIFFIFSFGVMMTEVRADAAVTCKSMISYPGKTNSKVNLRQKASTKYKSFGQLDKGQSVTILGYFTSGGSKWYKCKAKINGKTKTGYVSGSYIVLTTKPSGKVNNKVTSTLNIRKSAKTSSKSLLKIPKNTPVTILGIKKVSGKYWYKVSATYNKKTKKGYVLASYITVNTTAVANTTSGSNVTKQAAYVNEKVTTYLNVRESASTSSSILTRLKKHAPVTVIGTSGEWYHITATTGNSTVTGYAVKEYVTIGTAPVSNNTINDSDTTTNTTANTSDQSFETLLANFPESYKSKLRTLHTSYPNWKFVAVNTNLDWATVIANESVVGRNVIQSNYPKGTSSLAPLSYLSTAAGAYNWQTDQYTVKDGTNWYSANSAVISYYMDPRNFLNDTDIFQFEALAYDVSQSEQVVQSILSNTFMKGNYSVTDSATGKKVSGSYKGAFMDAGKTAKANPYFLASRSKQEVGTNGSNATSGTYKGYEGLYNFYNIGASDGANAVANGLSWAAGGSSKETTYGRPWTNPYKSIVGGAQYIAANYINKGQNTLYFQKFNVVPANTSLRYLHQYMTNVQAPYSEGRITRNAYNTMGILSDTMIFYIPVYNNMPASACELPASAGNPNPYLSDLSVYNGNTKLQLTPTFAKPKADGGTLSNSTYSMAVAKSVSQVTIKAKTISKNATVTGTGTFNLNAEGQTTTLKVVGQAQNGTTQTYTINITRNTQ